MPTLPVENPVAVFALVALLILLSPMVMARWRLPGTVGLLLAGALLGPHALGVLARDQSFVLFGTVGLLYIMFTAALEIDLQILKPAGGHHDLALERADELIVFADGRIQRPPDSRQSGAISAAPIRMLACPWVWNQRPPQKATNRAAMAAGKRSTNSRARR